MKYKVNEFVTATKALAEYSPAHRTEGKAYRIKRVNQDSVDIWNDKDNYGTFSSSEMEKFFIQKTENELWT